MEQTGLAIVGASAAGLTAAIAAARGGADVTLIEAKKQVGVPPSPAIVGLDSLWPQEVARPAHTTLRRLPGTKARGSDGLGPFVAEPLTLFDRAKFDNYLADEARKAGARILTGVQGLDARPDRTLVAEGLELRPQILLFADGARTQATRFVPSTRDPSAVQYGAILEFEAPEPEGEVSLYQTMGPHAPGGRSQLNPLGGGRWSHWTFFRGDPSRAEEHARRALEVEQRIMGWEKLDARFAGVGPDPLYTLPGQLVGEGVMVAGGAAGQGGLEPGLAAGWMAGEVAARALKDEAKLEEYALAWQKRYRGYYEGMRRANEMFRRLTDEEVRAAMGPWEGRRVRTRFTLGDLVKNPRGTLAMMRAGKIAKQRAQAEAQAQQAAEPQPVVGKA